MTDVEDSKMTSDCKAGWMPIDTAPRDGTVIDLWGGWSPPPFTRWADMYWGKEKTRLGFDYDWGWVCPDAGFEGEPARVDIIATHWMPLPPPPNND